MPPEFDHQVPLSAIYALIEPSRIDRLLGRFIPDPKERAFVSRCILEIGPAHHRGANYVLLGLLAQALERLVPEVAEPQEEVATTAIPIRLPLPQAATAEDRMYPLHMAIAPLRRLADGDEQRLAAMIDCLTDGPPQHALANAAMVNALGLLLEQLEADAK